MIKTCLGCGAVFSAKRKEAKYCTHRCYLGRERQLKPLKEVRCAFCKALLTRKQTLLGYTYCSRDCFYRARGRASAEQLVTRTHRICRKCDKERPVSDFYGHSTCKDCQAKVVSERERRKKREVVRYLGEVCSKCGCSGHPVIFAMHHSEPALKTYSYNQMRSRSMEVIKAWIKREKIVLVCHNCHALIHYT